MSNSSGVLVVTINDGILEGPDFKINGVDGETVFRSRYLGFTNSVKVMCFGGTSSEDTSSEGLLSFSAGVDIFLGDDFENKSAKK